MMPDPSLPRRAASALRASARRGPGALSAVWLVLSACGVRDVYVGADLPLEEPPPVAGGAAAEGDAAPGAPDAAPPSSRDAGMPALDAGPPPEDAAVSVDASAPVDASPPVDASMPVDASPPVDAAEPPDAGDAGALSCPDGFADCDGEPSNGCEVDLSSDDANCGGCDNACPADAPSSYGASCVEGACVHDCYLLNDDCDGIVDNGCEANLWISNQNCGACNVTCVCHDGRCL